MRGLSSILSIVLLLVITFIAVGLLFNIFSKQMSRWSKDIKDYFSQYNSSQDSLPLQEENNIENNSHFLFPSARSCGYFLMPYTRFDDNQKFPNYTADDVFKFWLNHYDLIVTNYLTDDYKKAEPGRIVLGGTCATGACCYNYTSRKLYWDDQLTDLYDWINKTWGDYSWSSSFANADEAFEDCFIHLIGDESMNFSFAMPSESLHITPYDPADPSRSRIPGAWDSSMWLMNIKSPVYISFWKDYYAVENANNSADGYFLDVLSWDRARDFSTQEDFLKIKEFSSKEEYEKKLGELVDVINSSLKVVYPNKILAANTFNFIDDSGSYPRFTYEDKLDMEIREGAIIYSIALPKFEKELEITSRLSKQNKIVGMQQMLWFAGSPFCEEGYGKCMDRDKITGLVAYYLVSADNVYFFSHDEPSVNPYSCWFDAIAYDIGKPVGDYYVFAEGQDSSNPSVNYKVFARNFTKALVLFKPRPSWGNTNYSSSSATLHNLPGNFRPLYVNGSLGPETNMISLRNWEGAILINSTEGSTPETNFPTFSL